MYTKQNLNQNDDDEPSSASSSTERKNHFGEFSIIKGGKNDYLFEDSGHSTTVEWRNRRHAGWITLVGGTILHAGKWSLEFHVESIQNYHIGVGFLYDWYNGTATGIERACGVKFIEWSYDPSTGDIVFDSTSIHGNLPKFTKDSGIIGLELDLPVNENGSFTFIVNGVRTPTKPLPAGAVVKPSVFLMKFGQRVTLRNLVQLN